MSRMVTITVDGAPLQAEEGRLLLPVLLEAGYDIAYFCYHEALGPDGNCRMCMVEIEGKKRPQISCDTFVTEGLVVRTKGEKIEKVRRDILELELINHPVDCPVCDQAGECALQDYYMEFGRYHGTVDKSQKHHFEKHVDLGSNVMHDQERCVLCQRCVRFCRDITKTGELCVAGRADHSRITTVPGMRLENDYAMNVVDLCPVGALTSRDFRFRQRVWFLESVPTVCHGCARGCNIWLDHAKSKFHDDTVYRFRPRKNEAVNGHFICDAGRLSYKELQENRLREIREGERVLSREEALERLKAKVAEVQTIVILADANLTLEELEALRLLAEELGAAIHAPLEPYIDDAFGDDWLKSAQRAANAGGVKRLGIDTAMPETDATTLILNANHPAAGFLAGERVDFLTHEPEEAAGLTLPIAAWAEVEGHLVNEEGIEQFCPRALRRDDAVPGLVEWIEAFDLYRKGSA